MNEHWPAFDVDTERKLQRLADDLPAIWDHLRAAGFHVFDLVFGHVEQLRERPPDERPYAYYFQEELKEKLGLYYTAGRPIPRATQQLWKYRSSYLDYLHAKIARAVPDENLVLYSQLKLTNLDRWKKFISEYKAQKRREIEGLREQIQALSAPPCKPTPTRISRLLEEALIPMGFEMVERNVKQGRFVLCRRLDEKLALYCEYDDHRGMVAGRAWHLVYVPLSLNASLWQGIKDYPALPLVLGLGSFIPGYFWYLQHGGDWDEIVLGSLINAKLLGILVARWKLY